MCNGRWIVLYLQSALYFFDKNVILHPSIRVLHSDLNRTWIWMLVLLQERKDFAVFNIFTQRKFCIKKTSWNRDGHRFQKGLFNKCPRCIVDGDFCLPNEIDSWNFQHMLLFWFREASQNLSLFRQLFFHSFQGGTKGKILKNQCIILAIFQHFSFGPPLETMKKKLSK